MKQKKVINEAKSHLYMKEKKKEVYVMATLFRGMSQDNFLNGLVQATGLNGRELYDFLIERARSEKVETEKPKEEVPQYNGITSFTGTRKEMYGFLELYGGDDRYTKNGKDMWSACTVDALANYAARLLKVQWFDFYWVMPNGRVERVCGENS